MTRRLAAPALPLSLGLGLVLALAGPARAQSGGDAPLDAVDASAETAAGAEAEPVPPVPVTVGFHVNDIRDVNLREQSFFADLYMWVRFALRGGGRGGGGLGPGDEAKDIERFELMNGRADVFEEVDRKDHEGVRYVCWRVAGTFAFKADLRNYPFDLQRFEIVIEHPALEVDRLIYVDDVGSYERSSLPPRFWAVREGLDIPEFTLRSVERRNAPSVYKTDFGDPEKEVSRSEYSRFVLSMVFARDFMPYCFKIIIPLVVIMAMAYLVFFLPPKEIETVCAIGITALLSCIAFNVAVGQNLPEVGYLIVSDKFFLMTYVLLLLTLLQSVLTYNWDDAGQHERAAAWDRGCRRVFPVLYIGAFAYIFGMALLSRG